MKTTTTMLLLLAVATAGCSKKPADSTPPTPSPTSTGAAPPSKAAAPAGAGGALLLTEEKVKGFIAYTRAITSVAGEAIGMAGEAFARGKVDKAALRREIAKDERAQKLARVGQMALQKSGLTQAEVSGLSRILARHYAKRMMAVNAATELEKLKGKQGNVLEGMYKKQVADGEAVRAEFEKSYGKEALAIVDKHEKDYLEVQQAMLKAAFRRMER